MYQALGAGKESVAQVYRELFRYQLEPGLIDQIRSATKGGYALGSARFAAQVRKKGTDLFIADFHAALSSKINLSPFFETFDGANGVCSAKPNFERWNKVMNKNWKNKASNQPLIAHLTRFWDVETPYATAAD